MSDKKVTQLQTLVSPSGVDRLLIIDNPTGTAVSKQISLDAFFGNIPCNTAITGTLTVSANTTLNGSNTYVTANVNVTGTTTLGVVKTTSNGMIILNSLTPANSSVAAIPTGKLFWDSSYLYIKVSNTAIKRVSLSSF